MNKNTYSADVRRLTTATTKAHKNSLPRKSLVLHINIPLPDLYVLNLNVTSQIPIQKCKESRKKPKLLILVLHEKFGKPLT